MVPGFDKPPRGGSAAESPAVDDNDVAAATDAADAGDFKAEDDDGTDEGKHNENAADVAEKPKQKESKGEAEEAKKNGQTEEEAEEAKKTKKRKREGAQKKHSTDDQEVPRLLFVQDVMSSQSTATPTHQYVVNLCG